MTRPFSQCIRPVRAQVGEVVDITWRNSEGETLHVRCLAPPPSTWQARVDRDEQAAMDRRTPSDTV
jgi:hypothetical protein